MKNNDLETNHRVDGSRRAVLAGIGAVTGIALTRGVSWVGSTDSQVSFEQLFTEFTQSLSSLQRQHTFSPADNPLRQVTLTEVVAKGPHIGTLYDGHQIRLIQKMYQRMLSQQGLDWMQNTIRLEGRFEGSSFKIYSQDADNANLKNSQLVINGGHYMVRTSGLPQSGYALGGPISYGQQLGNNRHKVEGNAFKAHGDAMDRFHRALNEQEKHIAYRDSPPSELLLQVQGTNVNFPGIQIGRVSDNAKEVAREMLETVLAGFTTAQQSEAWSAIDSNGGIESLHVALYRDFSFYQDGARLRDLNQDQQGLRSTPYAQVWRIEGPSMVIHFKGYPHVHAYMNIVRDPSKIAIGETLTETPVALGQAQTGSLIETMLNDRSGESLAFYPDEFLGRLSPGTVSTGSIYTLDPFANEMVVAEINSDTMSTGLKKSLSRQGVQLETDKRYRVATMDYMLEREDLFGAVESAFYSGETVREGMIDFVTDKNLQPYYS